jgi:hypothetical protein
MKAHYQGDQSQLDGRTVWFTSEINTFNDSMLAAWATRPRLAGCGIDHLAMLKMQEVR